MIIDKYLCVTNINHNDERDNYVIYINVDNNDILMIIVYYLLINMIILSIYIGSNL